MRLRREAKAAGGFYADPEPRVALVVRIRGINDLHPKTRKVLQLLRLRQIHNAVFVKVRERERDREKRDGERGATDGSDHSFIFFFPLLQL